MVTNAEEPAQKPGNREVAVEKLVELTGNTKRIARYVVTGDPQGPIRRRVLYLVVIMALVLDGTVGIVGALIGLIAALLLAMTDDVVELK